MIKFSGGREVWGNGYPENIPFEKEITTILEQGGLVLDVGCGKYKVHDSCLGVDPYAEDDSVNLKAYMWDMPFEDNSIDAIFTFHSMEHISKYQVLPTINEFARVLKPNGKLLILVPDLKWALSAFLINPTTDYEMDMIFGVQSHEGEFHKTGYTTEILLKYFNELNQFDIKLWFKVNAYNQYNIGILASKTEEVKNGR